MTEVFLIVEGQTERTFVKDLLYDHLLPRGVLALPELTGTRRTRRASRGGHHGAWAPIGHDIEATLKRHSPKRHWVTTMLDLYRLPEDTPGFVTSGTVPDPYRRVSLIERGIAGAVDHRGFIPYIQLHEFEALLLTDPTQIAWECEDRATGIDTLAAEVARYPGPECVNDGEDTAPSRRVARAVPRYRKALDGPRIAARIGLGRIIEACPHLAEWLRKLEALGEAGTS